MAARITRGKAWGGKTEGMKGFRWQGRTGSRRHPKEGKKGWVFRREGRRKKGKGGGVEAADKEFALRKQSWKEKVQSLH